MEKTAHPLSYCGQAAGRACGLLTALGFGLVLAFLQPAAVKAASSTKIVESYITHESDTLLDIAMQFDLGFVELAAANPEIDPWLPGHGREVTVPRLHLLPEVEHEGIVVNLAEMRLYQFEDGTFVKSYPVGIGQSGLQTPTGSTTVARKRKNPAWYPTPRMREEDPSLPEVVRAGPDNPLGSRALYLGWPSYLIHGTNQPYSVGRRTSSGCIRMYPDHVEALYPQIETGTPVTVIDEPLKLGWLDGELYLEAHPNQKQADQIEAGERMTVDFPLDFMDRLQEAAGETADRLDRAAVSEALIRRTGIPVRITR